MNPSSGAARALLVIGIVQLSFGSYQYVGHNAQGAGLSFVCGGALVVAALLRMRKG